MEQPEAAIEATVQLPGRPMAVRHRLVFAEVADRFEVTDETIENERASEPGGANRSFFLGRQTLVEEPQFQFRQVGLRVASEAELPPSRFTPPLQGRAEGPPLCQMPRP